MLALVLVLVLVVVVVVVVVGVVVLVLLIASPYCFKHCRHEGFLAQHAGDIKQLMHEGFSAQHTGDINTAGMKALQLSILLQTRTYGNG